MAELLAEKQFSKRRRQRLMVLACHEELLWVEGLGTAADRSEVARDEPLVCVEFESTSETFGPGKGSEIGSQDEGRSTENQGALRDGSRLET